VKAEINLVGMAIKGGPDDLVPKIILPTLNADLV